MKNDQSTLKDDLPSGGMTRFTSIFGAVGNYAMIGAAGMFAAERLVHMSSGQHKKLDKWQIATVGTTLVGAVFGAVYGLKEANDIQHYREAIADKIDTLQHQNAEKDVKIAELYEAVQAQAQGRVANAR